MDRYMGGIFMPSFIARWFCAVFFIMWVFPDPGFCDTASPVEEARAVAAKEGAAGKADALREKAEETDAEKELARERLLASRSLRPKGVNGKFGYANEAGEMVIPARFDNLPYSFDGDGLARVMANGKWGWIDPEGKEIIPLRFDGAWPFDSTGKAKVRLGKKVGWIDRKGEMLIPARYDGAHDDLDAYGLIRVVVDGKWGWIDGAGNEVIPPRFEEIGWFRFNRQPGTDGRAAVKLNGKTGWINRKGEMVIPPRFDRVSWFDEKGRAIVEVDGKVGIIDAQGKEIVPPRFEEISGFHFNSRGLSRVKLDGKYGWINEQGELVIPARYDAVYQDDGSWLPRDENIMALVREGGRWHCIDTKGESVAAFCLEPVEDILPQPVQMGENRYGYGVNYRHAGKKRRIVIAPRFEAAFPFGENGQAKVKEDGKWGYIDRRARRSFP
jgi:hypothetical protein